MAQRGSSRRFHHGAAALTLTLALSGCSNPEKQLNKMLEPLFPPSPGQIARDAFNVYDADTRRTSIAKLSAAPFGGNAEYVRLYRWRTEDQDATVRAAAVKALGDHGSSEDVKLFIPRLKDEAAFVRWESALALQKFHDPAAVQPLMETASKDDDADVRMAAASALGQYPEPRVFNTLVGSLNDTDFGVVQAAQRSLHTLTGYNFGTDGALWLTWAKDNQGKLFVNQEKYVWQPYEKERGWVDKAQFWKTYEPPAPQAPKGVADNAAPATQPGG